jgi:hypothetical protein
MPYQKTTAGLNEIQSRQLGLRAELRRLLIMVDGKSPIAKFAPAFPAADVEALARELAALGLIADPQAQPPAAAPAAPPPMTAPAPSTTATPSHEPPAEFGQPTPAQFMAARQAAVRFINDNLGPSGESLALRLERCKEPDELRAAVRDARASLERFLGASTGQRFMEYVRGAATNVV